MSGQTSRAHPVCSGAYPVFVLGDYPVNVLGDYPYIVPQLPRVVEGQCTLNYPACRLVIGCHRFLASDWSARGSCGYNDGVVTNTLTG